MLYYLHAVDAATRQFTNPSGAPFNPNLYSYTVGGAGPVMAGTLLPNRTFRLQFDAVPGSVYAIQAADFLTHPIPWTTLLTTNPGLPTPVLFDDPQTTNHPQRFYRTVSH